MLLDEANPRITTHHSRKTIKRWDGSEAYYDLTRKTVEWACDDAGGETTHEATYGGAGWDLLEYGADVPYGKPSGTYTEVYVTTFPGWTVYT